MVSFCSPKVLQVKTYYRNKYLVHLKIFCMKGWNQLIRENLVLMVSLYISFPKKCNAD